jgi:hypothetical protein
MAITERKEFGNITVPPDGQIQVREDTVLERDGVEFHREYHRHVVEPDADPNTLPERVKQVAQALWDDATVRAYKVAKFNRIPKDVGLAPIKAGDPARPPQPPIDIRDPRDRG